MLRTETLNPPCRRGLVFVPAARVHACNPATDTAWSYQMLHLDAAWLQAVRQEYVPASAESGDREPVRIVTEPTLYTRFCQLADQVHFQRVFKAYAGVTPGRFRA